MKVFFFLFFLPIVLPAQSADPGIPLLRKGYNTAEILPLSEPELAPPAHRVFTERTGNMTDTAWAKLPLPRMALKKRATVPFGIGSDFINRVGVKEKYVALTFDDGPLKTTPALMNFLREKNVRATFFVVTSNISKGTSHLYDRNDSLFEIGLHSHRHPMYTKLTPEEREADLALCLQTAKAFNLPAYLFRPPYGAYDAEVVSLLRKNGLRGVMWDIDTEDWRNYRGRDVVKYIDEKLQSGSIILFHDRVNLADLERVIDMVHQRGYAFVTISDLISAAQDYKLAKAKERENRRKFASGKQ